MPPTIRRRRMAISITLACFAATVGFDVAAAAPSAASVLQPFVDRHELAGAVVLVADAKGVLDAESVGFADIAAGRPMHEDTMFWIASQTKPMTAVALMMLVEEGKVSLDDPVEKHLPEFRDQMVTAFKDDGLLLLRRPVHPITIREVLCHMSGLPHKTLIQEPTLDGLPLQTTVRGAAMVPLQTQPGTAYLYSNAGISTAARVVEVVSGMPFEDFLQRRLLDPLGMKDTTFWPDEEQERRLAVSYKPDQANNGLEPFAIRQLRQPYGDRVHRFAMPSGGLFSSARDTARFCRMMLRDGELDGRRIISAASVREMTRRQTPETVKEAYGLGFALGPDWFGHGGANATLMEIRPADGLVLVWLVQHGGHPGEGGKAVGVFKDWARSRFAR
ncbi:MAG: class A beta-lactamase-related serine hydrolase [Planctomycetia bacterium]|nr:class A beta-lactamase-related serine hydrolase [Planctomycetia bacterium]